MKKLSINEFMNEFDVAESLEDAMKEINGGCRITVGRCLRDGTYYIMSLQKRCNNYVNHITMAITEAINSKIQPGEKYGPKYY